MKLPILSAVAIVLSLALPACSSSESAPNMDDVPTLGSPDPLDMAEDAAAEADLDGVDPGPEITAATGYIDPVCRMTIAEDAPDRYTHDGVTYGFCSGSCKGRFAEDPDAFLVAMEE